MRTVSGPVERIFNKYVAIQHPGAMTFAFIRSSSEVERGQEIFEKRGLTEAEAR